MKRRSRSLLLSSLFALGLLPAVGVAQSAPTVGQRVQVPGGAYWDITAAQLQQMMQQKDFPLINVHTPFQGDLPLTDASIPFNEILAHLNQLPSDKSAPIVLYCRSGPMSVTAATQLAGQGFTRVFNLVGGMRGWTEAGFPLAPTP